MFSEYIRGIIFFLVFASFIGIILPDGKYKSYINIVLGFIVMFLVFEPVSGLGSVVDGMSLELSQASVKNSTTYEAKYQELITDAFKKQMHEQMTRIAETMDYKLESLDADIDLETGELKSITMSLAQSADGRIRVDPVTIGDANTDEDNDIKKIVSDFYQLPEEHIHVTIQ